MRQFPRLTNISAMMLLLAMAFYMLGLNLTSVQAQTELLGIGERCTIPDSGPWPPCATGGGASASADCVIPDSGPWPPCATAGGSSPAPASGNECVIPESGPWPPCASGGGAAPAPSNTAECVVPASGPWPPCATGGVPPTIPAPAPAPEPQPEPEPAPESGDYAVTDVEILATDAYNIHGRFYQVNMPEGFQPAYVVFDPDFCVDECGNNIAKYRIIAFEQPDNPPTTGWIDFTVDIDNLICPYQPQSSRFLIAIADAGGDPRNRTFEVVYQFEFAHKWCE